jgi:hypothetical protein
MRRRPDRRRSGLGAVCRSRCGFRHRRGGRRGFRVTKPIAESRSGGCGRRGTHPEFGESRLVDRGIGAHSRIADHALARSRGVRITRLSADVVRPCGADGRYPPQCAVGVVAQEPGVDWARVRASLTTLSRSRREVPEQLPDIPASGGSLPDIPASGGSGADDPIEPQDVIAHGVGARYPQAPPTAGWRFCNRSGCAQSPATRGRGKRDANARRASPPTAATADRTRGGCRPRHHSAPTTDRHPAWLRAIPCYARGHGQR